MADKGIDLIVSKLLMVKDEKATYSVTGRVYRINDIVIRIGRAVVNGVAKNLLFLLLEAEGNFGAADRNIVVMTVVYLGLLGFANFSPFLENTSAPKKIGISGRTSDLENTASTFKCLNEAHYVGRVSFLYDDYTFFVPSWQDVAETTKVGGPAFFYEFTYPFVRDAYDLGPKLPKFNITQLAKHTYELIYLLGIHAGKFTEKDEIVREKFSQLFANFINTRRHLHRRIPLGALWSSYFRIDFDAQNRLPGMTSGYHTQTVHFLERVGEGRNDVLYEATEFWPDIYITKGLIPEEAKANFPTLKPGGANLDDSTNWSLLFKIAAALNIVLVILALIMCMMRCYNMKMRKEYERLK
ncbi:hypothetical protein QR680_019106 [Steinernema hermaphroditum]|uniref:Carboxylesterase type B domain-containing protein n=1 Tax=Steinernema hermaphroditum TaxID=289476 RepID=A0AA39HM55_9BILA|nr:hypothetical protein QR680_019106 [Steinernema hermaphroditum]